MSFHESKTPSGAPSQRQLRVGEDLRHLLASVFMQGDLYHPDLEGISITVTCVTLGGDLRQATAFVLPLGVEDPAEIKRIIGLLNELAPKVRHIIAPKITFKKVPSIKFQEDTSFSYGSKIEEKLQQQRNK